MLSRIISCFQKGMTVLLSNVSMVNRVLNNNDKKIWNGAAEEVLLLTVGITVRVHPRFFPCLFAVVFAVVVVFFNVRYLIPSKGNSPSSEWTCEGEDVKSFDGPHKGIRSIEDGATRPPSTKESRSTHQGWGRSPGAASQDMLLMNLATLCQQQQTEIDGLRRLVNEMTGTVERLERRLNDSHMRVETPLQELTIRLVTCYAIGQWLLGNPLLQARTAIAATSLAFAPRNLFICGMKEKFLLNSWDVRFFCRQCSRNLF